MRPSRIGEQTTVRAVIHNRRDSELGLRWSWDDGPRTWHANRAARPSTEHQVVVWQGVFTFAGVHRIGLALDPGSGPTSVAFVVVLPSIPVRLALSGQAIEEGAGHGRHSVPIGLLIPLDEGPGSGGAELRWQDRELEVRSREVSWVLDQRDGWLHLGGTAVGGMGTLNPFRAHFRLLHAKSPRVERAEIRLYPPGANPGVDPPQRVITGPIHALRRRGSTRA